MHAPRACSTCGSSWPIWRVAPMSVSGPPSRHVVVKWRYFASLSASRDDKLPRIHGHKSHPLDERLEQDELAKLFRRQHGSEELYEEFQVDRCLLHRIEIQCSRQHGSCQRISRVFLRRRMSIPHKPRIARLRQIMSHPVASSSDK